MKKIIGDLIELGLDGEFDVIIHGCNCKHKMGAGIAKSIAEKIPEAFFADKNWSKYADIEKLGSYTSVKVRNRNDGDLIVVNAYTQYDFKGLKNVNIKAISNVFEKIAIDFKDKKIAYPLIGCGLAGGDWNIIGPIIEEKLKGLDHTLILFPE